MNPKPLNAAERVPGILAGLNAFASLQGLRAGVCIALFAAPVSRSR